LIKIEMVKNMTDMDLHIFQKNTDANASIRGYLFQFAVTVECWLKNYIEGKGNKIFCEFEDDVRDHNLDSNTIKFSRVKCYSDSMSLKDEEVKKSIYNFFNLYLKYKGTNDVTFTFISTSNPAPIDSLLLGWIDNQSNLIGDMLFSCRCYITDILKGLFSEDFDNRISKINKRKETTSSNNILEEKKELEHTFLRISSLIETNGYMDSFVKSIQWVFLSNKPNESLKYVIESGKNLLKAAGKDALGDILYDRLLSEVIQRSSESVYNDRSLDDKLLNYIFEESAIDMMKYINPKINEFMLEIPKEIESLKSNLYDIENKVRIHIDSDNIEIVTNEIKRYTISKVDEFSQPIHNENFNLFDIFVLPDFEYYDFRGEFLSSEDIALMYTLDKNYKEMNILELIFGNMVSSENNNIIFIHGDPGVGKSTFSKFLFREVSQMFDVGTIHIDLKRFKFARDFKSAIKQEMEELSPSFRLVHFDLFEMKLILDGFDELHLLSDGQMHDFLISIKEFNSQYPKTKIILTGRTTAFQHYLSHIPKNSLMVELNHFSNEQIIQWVQNWLKFKKYDEPLADKILQLDHNKNRYEDEDEGIHAEEKEFLVSLPLFLYLFCTMIYEDRELNVEELINLNKWQFYKSLIDWTCATTKYQDEYNPLHKKMDLIKLAEYKRTFNKNVSLSMYHSNKFYITNRDITNRSLLPSILSIKEEDVSELINSFIVLNYMKPKLERHSQEYAFEYIHKSFYEYLTAEALLDLLCDLSGDILDDSVIARIMYSGFGGFKLGEELLESYLLPLLSRVDKTNLNEIFDNLSSFYRTYYLNHKFINENNIDYLSNYLLIYPDNAKNKITMESNVLFSLLKLLSFLGEVCGRLFKINQNDLTKEFNKVIQFSNDAFKANELKLNFIDLQGSEIENVNLSGIELADSDLSNSSIQFTNLSSSNLVGSNLSNVIIEYSNMDICQLNFTDFSYAKISSSRLEDISLVDSTLTNVEIFKCDLTNAALDRCEMVNVKITQCNLSGVVLDNSDMTYAHLIDVVLDGGSLRQCDLSFSNCSNSSLQRATLRDSTLRSSVFQNADLSYADLSNTDFSDANLAGADLSFANLTNAIFKNSDLSSVNLSNAIIRNTNFNGANLCAAALHYSRCESVDFTESCLDGVDLSTMLMSRVIFNRTSLRRTLIFGQDFTTVNSMVESDLSFSNIKYSNFDGIDFNGSVFDNAKILVSFFTDSDFSRCSFNRSTIEQCKMGLVNFNNAKIYNSTFIKCDLFEANFMNADVRDSNMKLSNLRCSNIYKREKGYKFMNVELP
jgi:uncharacterized protein YjbI with pentapeptide repeats/tRNA A37 threonylcarbamoyladenosine biosynthesis protein TsaE